MYIVLHINIYIYIDLFIILLRIFKIYMNGHILRYPVDSTTRAQRRLLDRCVIPHQRNRFECRLPGCQEEWRLRYVPQVNLCQYVVLFHNLCHCHVSPHHATSLIICRSIVHLPSTSDPYQQSPLRSLKYPFFVLLVYDRYIMYNYDQRISTILFRHVQRTR